MAVATLEVQRPRAQRRHVVHERRRLPLPLMDNVLREVDNVPHHEDNDEGARVVGGGVGAAGVRKQGGQETI